MSKITTGYCPILKKNIKIENTHKKTFANTEHLAICQQKNKQCQGNCTACTLMCTE